MGMDKLELSQGEALVYETVKGLMSGGLQLAAPNCFADLCLCV